MILRAPGYNFHPCMFETVAPEAFEKRSRFVLYESLPLSLAVHALAIGSIVAATITHVTFPDDPPRLVFAYSISQAEAPPPPPPPPAAARPQNMTADAIRLAQELAPTVIPDTLPVVPAPQFAALEPELPTTPTQGVEGGVFGGVIGGDPIAGVPGGVISTGPRPVMGGLLMDDGRVHFARDAPLPMYLERQDKPEYPEEGRLANWEDDVVVRYIIGKDGRVKELTVLAHADRKIFEKATLEAISNWRFRPLLVDNEPREVVHELMVHFRLQ